VWEWGQVGVLVGVEVWEWVQVEVKEWE